MLPRSSVSTAHGVATPSTGAIAERRREGHLEHDEVDPALLREERERQGRPAPDRKAEPGEVRLHRRGVFLEGDRATRPAAARGERRVEALQVQRIREQPVDLEPDHRGVAVEEGHEPVGLGPRVDPDRVHGYRLPLLRGEEGAKVAVTQEKERVPRRRAGRMEDGGPAAPVRAEHEHDAPRGLRRGEEQEDGRGNARRERGPGGLTGFVAGRPLDEPRGDERDQEPSEELEEETVAVIAGPEAPEEPSDDDDGRDRAEMRVLPEGDERGEGHQPAEREPAGRRGELGEAFRPERREERPAEGLDGGGGPPPQVLDVVRG